MKKIGTILRSEQILDFKGTQYRRVTISKNIDGNVKKDVAWKNYSGKKSVTAAKSKELTAVYNKEFNINTGTEIYKPSVRIEDKTIRQNVSSNSVIAAYNGPHKLPQYKSGLRNTDKLAIEKTLAGRKLSAVKFIKELTSMGLKDSKEYVDALVDKFCFNGKLK